MFDTKKLLDALMGAGAAQGQGTGPATGPGTGQSGGGGAGGLGGMLGQLADQVKQGASGAPAAGGGFASIIGQVLGKATSGVQDAARGVEARTGVGTKANEALKQATGGKGAGDLLAQARELASQNKLATGVGLGGLAAILLGTEGGRDVAVGAAKMGGLAVIGGLAYKAFQNYQAGKPLIDLGGGIQAPPEESAFGATADEAQDSQTALLLVRAMIAAASSDGIVDNQERSRIVGGLEQSGLDVQAASFLDHEFAKPASVEALVAGATTPEIAAQVYTAARLAVDPDHPAEQRFLARLAAGLHLQPQLVANIDAAARAAQNRG
jgi:uncharacterized membrane protein YebE (DUF533 family)